MQAAAGVPGSIMRKFVFGFGVVMAALLVGGAVGLFALSRDGAALDTQSRAYVDDAVIKISRHWDASGLWQRASAHFRQTTKEDDLYAFFEAADDALGPLTAYRGARGEAVISFLDGGTLVTARYIAEASFTKGNAEIQVLAVKSGDAWRIDGFHINSAALMQRMAGLKS